MSRHACGTCLECHAVQGPECRRSWLTDCLKKSRSPLISLLVLLQRLFVIGNDSYAHTPPPSLTKVRNQSDHPIHETTKGKECTVSFRSQLSRFGHTTLTHIFPMALSSHSLVLQFHRARSRMDACSAGLPATHGVVDLRPIFRRMFPLKRLLFHFMRSNDPQVLIHMRRNISVCPMKVKQGDLSPVCPTTALPVMPHQKCMS